MDQERPSIYDIKDLLEEDMISMTAYYACYFQSDFSTKKNIPSANKIPFVTNPLFPFMLATYLLFNKIIRYYEKDPKLTGHIFIISSKPYYRLHTGLEISKHLQEENTILGTSAAIKRIDETDASSVSEILSYRQLFQTIKLRQVLGSFLRSVKLTRQVSNRFDGLSLRSKSIVLNVVFAETIKSASFKNAQNNIYSCNFHSPSAYILENIPDEKLFIYQHGQGISLTQRLAAADVSLTYITWGTGWDPEEYCTNDAIEKIKFKPLGNVMFDRLLETRKSQAQPSDFDILFISNSHARSGESLERYEDLFKRIVTICENNDYTLAVKLHRPVEDSSFYEERGWSKYIIDENLEDSILNSRITVADASTVFLESIILGNPCVLTQLTKSIHDQNLVEKSPGVYTIDKEKELEDQIRIAMEDSVSIQKLNNSGIFTLGDTGERIADFLSQSSTNYSSASNVTR